MILVVAVSDLHGHLPNIPPCDILLVAGDIAPSSHIALQEKWLKTAFRDWLERVPAKEIVGIAGNHDFIFEQKPDLVPKLKWKYLQDSQIELFGLKIWGTPWQPRFYDWAFNADEPDLKNKFNLIPTGTDILVSHGPPFGIGDYVPGRNGGDLEHVGSPSLLDRVLKVKPKLHVFGHIHEGRGEYERDGVKFVNATVVDRRYKLSYLPMIFEMKTTEGIKEQEVSNE